MVRAGPTPRRKREKLLLPLFSTLWLSLHLVYGLYRVFRHLRQRQWREDIADPKTVSTEVIQSDQQRWQKTPKRLAVIFTPSRTIMSFARLLEIITRGRWRYVARPSQRLQGLAEDACLLASWCISVEIKELTLFDQEGLFVEYAHLFVKILANQPGFDIPDITEATFKNEGLGIVSINTNFNSQTLKINLVSPDAGKQHLERIAKQIEIDEKASVYDASNQVDGFVQEWLASPELLLILGGTHLRLQDFPPWQLSLTEMCHAPSLDLLGPARLSYASFVKAMDVFSGCEMRFGK